MVWRFHIVIKGITQSKFAISLIVQYDNLTGLITLSCLQTAHYFYERVNTVLDIVSGDCVMQPWERESRPQAWPKAKNVLHKARGGEGEGATVVSCPWSCRGFTVPPRWQGICPPLESLTGWVRTVYNWLFSILPSSCRLQATYNNAFVSLVCINCVL